MSKSELQLDTMDQERVEHNMRESYHQEMENLVNYFYNADCERARAEKFIRDNGLWKKYTGEKLPF